MGNYQNEDLQELQKGTFNIVNIAGYVIAIIVLYFSFIFLTTSQFNSFPSFFLLASAVVLMLSAMISRTNYKQNEITKAAIQMVSGYVIMVDILLLLPGSLTSFVPYLFLMIVAVSGMIISPYASFSVAIGCIISSVIIVGMFLGFTAENMKQLVAPGGLSFLMAVVTWGGAENLITAFSWALSSEARARERRDELFTSQQALQYANLLLENTNFRLKEAEQAAIDANETKTKFMTNLSHELRTPLNAIINFSFLMSHNRFGELNQTQKDYLDRIQKSGEHLLNMVNDLLDLAKIEAGQMDLFIEGVQFAEMAPSLLAVTEGLLGEKPITLMSDIPADLPLVAADPARLRQVVINLLGNAAKYTDKGYIRLKAKPVGGNLVIAVEDTGMGIKEADFAMIFKEFHQTEESIARKRTGTGLGLPISKRFIEMHGGKIWLESQINIGSTFYVSLPLYTESQNEETLPATDIVFPVETSSDVPSPTVPDSELKLPTLPILKEDN